MKTTDRAWNVAEQLLTRAADALVTLALVYWVQPEVFGVLALSQAWVGPVLLFFVSPETVLYRDYGKWRDQGVSVLASRVAHLRRFAWGKAQAGIGVALLLAAFFPIHPAERYDAGYWERAAILGWALGLALGPQIQGADREFLRMDLQLRRLSVLSLLQRGLALSLTLAVILSHGSLAWLVLAGVIPSGICAVLARVWVVSSLRARGASAAAIRGREGSSAIEVLKEATAGFSIWVHISGVVQGWVQTLDVLLLSWVGTPVRLLGIYSAVLKLANLTSAIPLALSNSYSVELSRQSEGSSLDAASARSSSLSDGLKRRSLQLAGVSIAQAAVWVFVSPWALAWISKGRWTEAELESARSWLIWITGGLVLWQSALVLSAWVMLRRSARELCLGISMPWLLGGALLYGWAVSGGGTTEQILNRAALANLGVGLVYWLTLAWSGRAWIWRQGLRE